MFKDLMKLAPKNLNCVLVYNKAKKEHEEKQIYRRYRSYGKVPEFDPRIKKSYMFSGWEGLEKEQDIPEVVKNIMEDNPEYNQCVVNWYMSGDEYIEPHSDCDAHMIDNYKIKIINFTEVPDRIFRLKHKTDSRKDINIKLGNNTEIILDKRLNTEYRHEVPASSNFKSQRVSVTLRQIK